MSCAECERIGRELIRCEAEYAAAQADFIRISAGPADPVLRSQVVTELLRIKQKRARLRQDARVHLNTSHSADFDNYAAADEGAASES